MLLFYSKKTVVKAQNHWIKFGHNIQSFIIFFKIPISAQIVGKNTKYQINGTTSAVFLSFINNYFGYKLKIKKIKMQPVQSLLLQIINIAQFEAQKQLLNYFVQQNRDQLFNYSDFLHPQPNNQELIRLNCLFSFFADQQMLLKSLPNANNSTMKNSEIQNSSSLEVSDNINQKIRQQIIKGENNRENQVRQICDLNKKKRQKRTGKNDQQYQPIQPQSYDKLPSKASDTKNIIKIFTRAMLTQTIKNKQSLQKLFKKHQIDQTQFFEYVESSRQKIETIADLRNMWLEKQNKYGKLMRILSFQYLRKRHLQHVFNSKIKNISKNIKYRKKLIQGSKKPQLFVAIKQY